MRRFAACLTVVTLAALVYVYEEVEAVKTGYAIRRQEEAKTLLLDRGRALKFSIANLKAPHNLERKLLAQHITLASPKSWQTLVMPGAGGPRASEMAGTSPAIRVPFVAKFFVGTAQAEARESD
ncbi:MAG: hypothetical protein HYZ52_03250 [Candidatus Omnitrophica bacterium]|nr:hypothetical protein [Candidatus Omnitrophota bacterium]